MTARVLRDTVRMGTYTVAFLYGGWKVWAFLIACDVILPVLDSWVERVEGPQP